HAAHAVGTPPLDRPAHAVHCGDGGTRPARQTRDEGPREVERRPELLDVEERHAEPLWTAVAGRAVSGTWSQHATVPSPTATGGGSTLRQTSMTCGHRGWNRHPGG